MSNYAIAFVAPDGLLLCLFRIGEIWDHKNLAN